MFDYSKADAELFLYDEISEPGRGGIDAGTVMQAMKDIGPQPLTVRINSPGGSVDEGIAIFNALERHPANVTTINDSLAASISHLIFMAGADRLVASNSRSMIHEPWSVSAGSAADFRKLAAQLDAAAIVIRDTIVTKTGMNEAKVMEMMIEESWFSAAQARANGMATGIEKPSDVVSAKVVAGVFTKTPEDLIVRLAAGSKTPLVRKRSASLDQLAAEVAKLEQAGI